MKQVNLFRRFSGFTLVELIAVIAVVGIVSAIAAPRLIGRSAFDEMGFYNEAIATTQYAQKIAIAQRRDVCVVIQANQIALVYFNAGACNGSAINKPSSADALVALAPNGVTISAGSTFYYNRFGEPRTLAGAAQATQTVTISGRAYTIEGQTGYVHA